MDRDHRFGSFCDRLFEARRIHVVRDRIDVHQDGLGAGVTDREGRRDKGVRRRDHFVARANVKGAQRELQGRRARIHADGMADVQRLGELVFKLLELLSEDKVTLRQDC